MSMGNGNPNIQWCTECHRYFNPEHPHECRDNEIKANRHQLEQWLGDFKITKEG